MSTQSSHMMSTFFITSFNVQTPRPPHIYITILPPYQTHCPSPQTPCTSQTPPPEQRKVDTTIDFDGVL